MPKPGSSRRGVEDPWSELMAAQFAVGASFVQAFAAWLPQVKPQSESEGADEFWSSPNSVVRELRTMRVREFADPDGAGSGKGNRALIVAPFALHRASIVDFAPGFSLVEALGENGLKIYVTDWRSATEERRFDTIDSLLADLNVAVDDIGAGHPLVLIGLCQGGWLAAAYGARFPRKVAALVLAGAPIDIAAERSAIADICAATPIRAVEELIRLGNGLVTGRQFNALWPFAAPTNEFVTDALQLSAPSGGGEGVALLQRFRRWFDSFVDLPGVYFQQTFEWIFRENRLARGTFRALGETIHLEKICCPMFLLVAEADEITSPGQLTAISHLLRARPPLIETHRVAGRHLSLFMGRKTLAQAWPQVSGFVGRANRTRRVRSPRSSSRLSRYGRARKHSRHSQNLV